MELIEQHGQVWLSSGTATLAFSSSGSSVSSESSGGDGLAAA